MPLDRLLVETDSPYLAPVPYRGKTNRPGWVKYVAEEVARQLHAGARRQAALRGKSELRCRAKRVGDVDWPQDTALVAIIREGRPIAPSPDDPLEAGDELLFVISSDLEDELETLLSPRTHGG